MSIQIFGDGSVYPHDPADDTRSTGGAAIAQTDWNAAEGMPGHIKGRTHWVESELVEILPECQPTLVEDSGDSLFVLDDLNVVAGETYIVNWNGTEYKCVAQDIGVPVIGNMSLLDGDDTGEPFTIVCENSWAAVPLDGTTELTLSIKHEAEVVHKLPNKFLDLEWIPTSVNQQNEVFPETQVGDHTAAGAEGIKEDPGFVAGEKYIVYYGGTPYECTAREYPVEDDGYSGFLIVLGNTAIDDKVESSDLPEGIDKTDTGEPFLVYTSYVDGYGFAGGKLMRGDEPAGETVTIKIDSFVSEPVKMPGKYLPEGVPYIEDGGIVEILPEMQVQVDEEDEGLMYLPPVSVQAGETYTVVWDGVEYTCVGVEFTDGDITAVCFGDVYTMSGGQLGGESTGEPFAMICIPEQVCMVASFTWTTEDPLPTVAIYSDGKTYHKLDNRLLDLVWLPTVKTSIGDILPECQPTYDAGFFKLESVIPIEANKEYTVNWNGTEYNVTAVLVSAETGVCGMGNLGAIDSNFPTTDEPFAVSTYPDQGYSVFMSTADSSLRTITVSIQGEVKVPNKIPEAFLPDGLATEEYVNNAIPTTLPNPNALMFHGATAFSYDGSSEQRVYIVGRAGTGVYAELFNGASKASGGYSHAEGYLTTASGYGSHAEGQSTYQAPDTITSASTNDEIIAAWDAKNFALAKGQGAHVEGINGLALGHYDHAEGNDTKAFGGSSHAEGSKTKASGGYSHAEGYKTVASGGSSHAEGESTIASGMKSHVEGFLSQATGEYSHAEGYYSIASGKRSHAEGYGTIAASTYQHVQGVHNVEDSADIYAHIVGNGKSDTERSNAHTLDWDGNAWFAGSMTADGGIIIPSSTPGSTKKFKLTIDDSGTISATEVTA